MANEKDMAKEVQVEGLFKSALNRNTKDIKEARATAINDGAEMSYKRLVEDLIQKKKTLEMEKAEMLDMSPDSAISLILAKNFDARKFAEQYLQLGVKIRLLDIEIEIGKNDYLELFGGVI